MTTITIDEAINGYTVSIFNWYDGTKYKENCERRIDALQIVSDYLSKEMKKELLLITKGALQ